MANTELTGLTAITTPVSGDKFYIVDVSDTTDSANGSSRQITYTNFVAGILTEQGITASVAELNTLDGITASVTELNFVDGVTSAIQTQIDTKASVTQLNLKAPLASPTFTGTVVLPNSQIITSPVLNTGFSGTAKATGAEINTGTEDAKIVTPKAIADSYIGSNYQSLARNCLINAGFTVNQRVYVSNAALATTVYGHDRWKAGAGGGDYTFTQLAQSTVITIKADKTLIQVIEDKNVIGGIYTLSWTGTAQARYAVNSATPAGAYADSPIAITGQTAGTVMSIEFNAGTLSNVVLNSGTVALPFMSKSYDDESRACMRYYQRITSPQANTAITNQMCFVDAGNIDFLLRHTPMRIVPIMSMVGTVSIDFDVYNSSYTKQTFTAFANQSTSATNGIARFRMTKATHGLTYPYFFGFVTTTGAIVLTAEL